MLIPNGATVSAFSDVQPGSLLIGSLGSDRPNFVGLRADYKINGGTAPHVVVLNAREWQKDLEFPRVMSGGFGSVLNLGREWSIDVELTPTTPSFDRRTGPLCFSGDRFYLMVENVGYGSYAFLDMKTGDMTVNSPDGERVCWPTFRIMLPQPGTAGPGIEIFAWRDGTEDKTAV